jgi:hypothetical protein
MKNILIATAALLVATSAYATDLPSKAAPVVPSSSATVTSTDSLSVAYGQDVATGDFRSKTNDIYQLTYKHNLGSGFFVGGMAQTTQSSNSKLDQNLELQAGVSSPSFAGVIVTGKIGIGEKFSTNNFGYYALYGNADYKLSDKFTLNALQYRYRNAFESSNNYETHQIGTGVTYDVTTVYSVNAKIARNYDNSYKTIGDQFMVGLTAKF